MSWLLALLPFLSSILPLVLKFYDEYLSQKAKAEAENKQFQVDQAKLLAIINTVIEREQATAAQASAGAGSAWDAADQNGKKPS